MPLARLERTRNAYREWSHIEVAARECRICQVWKLCTNAVCDGCRHGAARVLADGFSEVDPNDDLGTAKDPR